MARGITPGSENDVRKRVARTKVNRRPPTAGMAGVILTAKNGQLSKVAKSNELDLYANGGWTLCVIISSLVNSKTNKITRTYAS